MSSDYIPNEYKNKAEEIMREMYKLGYKDGISDGKIKIEEAYNNGLNAAWEAARKIVKIEYEEAHDVWDATQILESYSAVEAIEKIKEYESHVPDKDVGEIKVGDEIVRGDAHVVITYLDKIPMKNNEYYRWNGMLLNTCNAGKAGGTYSGMTGFKHWTKTGKYYPQIAEVLRQMKELQKEKCYYDDGGLHAECLFCDKDCEVLK